MDPVNVNSHKLERLHLAGPTIVAGYNLAVPRHCASTGRSGP